jgi:hypothetical protein
MSTGVVYYIYMSYIITDDMADNKPCDPEHKKKVEEWYGKWWENVEDHYITHQFTRGKVSTYSMTKREKLPVRPEIYYMAHPVSPWEGETVRSNLESAKCYLRWFLSQGVPIAAPWMPYVEIFDSKGEEAEHRDQCLGYSCAMAKQFAGIICVGKRVSSGMLKEIRAHVDGAQHSRVFDVTGYLSVSEASDALFDVLKVLK